MKVICKYVEYDDICQYVIGGVYDCDFFDNKYVVHYSFTFNNNKCIIDYSYSDTSFNKRFMTENELRRDKLKKLDKCVAVFNRVGL